MKNLLYLLFFLPFFAGAQSGTFTDLNLPVGATQPQRDSIRIADSLANALKLTAITSTRLADSLAKYEPKLGTKTLVTINGQALPLGGSATISAVAAGSYIPTSINVKDKGAVGDNVTNDGPAINEALSSGSRLVLLERNKTYYSTARLIIPSGVTLDLNGATIRFGGSILSASEGLIRSQYDEGDKLYSATTTISVKKGNSYFVTSVAANITAATNIVVQGGNRWVSPNYPYLYGWYTSALRRSNDTVYTTTPADTTFTATAINNYRTHYNIHIMNGTIDVSGTTTVYAIELKNCNNSSVTNVVIKGTPGPLSKVNQGIFLTGISSHVSNNWIYGGGEEVTSYGIQLCGVSLTASGNFIQGFKHGIASGGQDWFSSNLVYYKNTVTADWTNAAALDFHANVMSGKILYNKVAGGRRAVYVINCRGKNILIEGNEIYIYHPGTSTVSRGIDLDELASHIKIYKNDFFVFTEATTATLTGNLVAVSVAAAFPVDYLVIEGNTMHHGGNIDINGGAGKGLVIRNNTMIGHPLRPIFINASTGTMDGYEISGNRIVQNFQSNSSHYTIWIGSAAKWGFVKDNEIRVTWAANVQNPIRLSSTGNSVLNNTLYSEGGTIDHQATNKASWVLNNKRVSSSGVFTTISGQTALPPASAFFEGRHLLIGGTYYLCLKNQSSGVFSWVATATAP